MTIWKKYKMVIILEITNFDTMVLQSSAFTEDSMILFYLIYKESKKSIWLHEYLQMKRKQLTKYKSIT